MTKTACDAPIRDRTKTVSIAGIVGGVLSVVAFILRIAARFRCLGGQFGWDDATMVFTMVWSLDPSVGFFSNADCFADDGDSIVRVLGSLYVFHQIPLVKKR